MVLDDAPDGSRGLFRVTTSVGLSRAAFAVSGQVTRVTLAGDDYSSFDDATDVREVVAYAVPEQLTVAPAPDHSPVAGDTVVVVAEAGSLAPGAPVVVAGSTIAGTTGAELGVVEAVSSAGDGHFALTLVDDLEDDWVRATVVVHGNVAPATHGETVDEVLGAGLGNATFQRFALSHGPLTHVSATGADATGPGVASTLVVRVNDVAWDEAATLYDTDAADHAYTSTVDEHGDRIVTFGDGRHGARLPTGTNNVRATYRKGLGTAGNVAAGQLAQLLDRPLGLKGVANPVAAAGGVDPEAPEDARRAIPLRVRTLGRVVSLLDYQDEAAAWPGISKAHATVLSLATGRTIVVTVAPTPGTGDATQRLADLATALREHGDPQVALQVVAQRLDTFRLSLRVTVADDHDPDLVLAGITEAVRTAFGFDARDLLDPVHASEVVAVAHEVPGVVGLDLDRLYAPGLPLPPCLLADRLVPRQPAVGSPTTVLPAGLLVVADEPFDTLEVVS
nr:baseplate J/gp47 family protein [Salsipaludibacter albus]